MSADFFLSPPGMVLFVSSQELHINVSSFLVPIPTPPVATHTLNSPTVFSSRHSRLRTQPPQPRPEPTASPLRDLHLSAPHLCAPLSLTLLFRTLVGEGSPLLLRPGNARQDWKSADPGSRPAPQLTGGATSGKPSFPGPRFLHLPNGDE